HPTRLKITIRPQLPGDRGRGRLGREGPRRQSGVDRALARLRRSPGVVAPFAGARRPSHFDDAVASLDIEPTTTRHPRSRPAMRPDTTSRAPPSTPNSPASGTTPASA